MSSKDTNSPKESKFSPTSSDEIQQKLNVEKNAENLSDEENLSGFDSDSECENGRNGKKIN